MQIKQKENKKLLTDKSAAVALKKMATEKAKQSILSLQSELDMLKAESCSNAKKLELRRNYSSRLDDLINSKQQEVKIQKGVLKDNESADSESSQGGPDVMQYIMRKAQIYELQESIKTMERKIEIARGSRKNSRCRESSQGSNSFHWQPGML